MVGYGQAKLNDGCDVHNDIASVFIGSTALFLPIKVHRKHKKMLNNSS